MQRHQLRLYPLCQMCLDHGTIQAAEVVDHVVPHKGNYSLFWFGKLQSLCSHHHNIDKKQIEDRGYIKQIGIDGYPIDSNHPVNR